MQQCNLVHIPYTRMHPCMQEHMHTYNLKSANESTLFLFEHHSRRIDA